MENVKNAGRAEMAALMERILYEVKKVVVGQDHFLERVLVAILAQGHLLLDRRLDDLQRDALPRRRLPLANAPSRSSLASSGPDQRAHFSR